MTPYHDLLADIALRVNAFNAPIPATLLVSYATRPLTSGLFNSADFSFDAMISALAGAEEKLANAIASTVDEIDRVYLAGVTDPLSTGDFMPALDSIGASIIGAYGTIRDGDDATILTERPLQEIQRLNRNADTFYVIPAYFFKIVGNRIEHTRTTVVVDVCSYDRDTQVAAINANADMLLADDLGEAIVCGAVAALVRDDEYTQQAALYAEYFTSTLSRYLPTTEKGAAAR